MNNPQSCYARVFSLLGGLKKKEQTFNATAASMNCGLLFMAVAGLMMPAGMCWSFRTQFHYWCCIYIGVVKRKARGCYHHCAWMIFAQYIAIAYPHTTCVSMRSSPAFVSQF